MREPLQDFIINAYVRCWYHIQQNQQLLLMLLGIALLLSGTSHMAEAGRGAGSGYNDGRFKLICEAILKMHEGGYGSLLSSAAGIGAIVASAMGGFKMAWALLVVSVGSFLLAEYESLWFNKCS